MLHALGDESCIEGVKAEDTGYDADVASHEIAASCRVRLSKGVRGVKNDRRIR